MGEIDRFVTDSRGLLTLCGRVWILVSGGIRKTVLEEAHKSRFCTLGIHQDVSRFEIELLVAMYKGGDILLC